MIRVWDLPVRMFHWLLVALLALSWWSGEQHEMEWHRLSGYCIGALLIFRIWWGFAGSRTARFAGFLRGPAAVLSYAKTLWARGGSGYDGHNPIGGWAVLAMLTALCAMVAAGLFAVDVDGFESGPLADYISFDQGRAAAEVHEVIFKLLLGLVALHVAAIVFYLVFKGSNLIGPMITGRRPRNFSDGAQDIRWSPILAIVGVVVAVSSIYAVSNGLRF